MQDLLNYEICFMKQPRIMFDGFPGTSSFQVLTKEFLPASHSMLYETGKDTCFIIRLTTDTP